MKNEKEYYDPYFHGTDTFWKHPYGFSYTDSIRYFVEEYHAYWLLDLVGSYISFLQQYDFLVLYFDVEDSKCSFSAREDTEEPDIIHQNIEYTDLSVSVKLFFIDGILLFPSDY